MIDLSLFRLPAFSTSLAAYLIATFVVFGIFVFIAQHLQLVIGLDPLEAGLWTMPSALAFIIGSMLTPIFAGRIRPAFVMATGLVVSAFGFALLTQAGGSAGAGPTIVVAGSVIVSLGIAPVFTLATDLIVGAAPQERAGAAAAISETSSEFGGALGIAILGSIGIAIYRGVMANAVIDVPPEAAEAARDTLGGALAAAARLPDVLGARLIGAAREAFTIGFDVIAVVCAVAVLATAVVVVLLLRNVRPASGH